MDHVTSSVNHVISRLKGNIEYTVERDTITNTRWMIQVRNRDIPNTLLEVEILQREGNYIGCVLQKVNVGRSVMVRFMDKLMDELEDPKPT